jgi:hypothetical protein
MELKASHVVVDFGTQASTSCPATLVAFVDCQGEPVGQVVVTAARTGVQCPPVVWVWKVVLMQVVPPPHSESLPHVPHSPTVPRGFPVQVRASTVHALPLAHWAASAGEPGMHWTHPPRSVAQTLVVQLVRPVRAHWASWVQPAVQVLLGPQTGAAGSVQSFPVRHATHAPAPPQWGALVKRLHWASVEQLLTQVLPAPQTGAFGSPQSASLRQPTHAPAPPQ